MKRRERGPGEKERKEKETVDPLLSPKSSQTTIFSATPSSPQSVFFPKNRGSILNFWKIEASRYQPGRGRMRAYRTFFGSFLYVIKRCCGPWAKNRALWQSSKRLKIHKIKDGGRHRRIALTSIISSYVFSIKTKEVAASPGRSYRKKK